MSDYLFDVKTAAHTIIALGEYVNQHCLLSVYEVIEVILLLSIEF